MFAMQEGPDRMRDGATAMAGQKDNFLKHRPMGLKDRQVEDRIESAEARRKVEEDRQEIFDSWNAEIVIPRLERPERGT